MTVAGPPVVLVEHRAHERAGHFVTVVHQLTRALVAEGHEVHVLTSRGIDRDGYPSAAEGAVVHEARWPWRSATGRRDGLMGVLGQVAIVASVRALTRQLAGACPPPVLLLTMGADPRWANLLAPSRADWTVYVLDPPPERRRLRWARFVDALASHQARRRARRGGVVRVRANHDGATTGWRERHPWIDIETATIAGTQTPTPTPSAEARGQLGLAPAGRLALAFGSAHSGKDLDTIVRAFAAPDAPAHLLLAGAGVAAAVTRVRDRDPHLDLASITVIDGAQSEVVHHLAHSAADSVVLSFQAGRRGDSGALIDAIGHRLPVCCSDDCRAGELVAALGVGCTFPTGDAAALRAAVATLDGVRLRDADVARLPLPTGAEVVHGLLPSLRRTET